jgi:hypothetical protein
MSGLGIMQREILRRARGSFAVREIALRLYPTIDDTNLGAVRRAVRGLEASGYLVHEPLPRPQAALARVNALVLKSLRGSVYVVHGFRATFSGDWAAKAGYSLELRERALHHVVGDSSLVAYNRDELVEQRRPMMAAWAKFAIGTR